MDDVLVGGIVADAPMGSIVVADGPLAAAVVVEPEIDVELGAGQGVAGAQGKTGEAGPSGPAAQAQTFQILGTSSFNAAHGLAYVPSVRITDATGSEVDTDLFHSPGQVTAVFPGPFVGVLTVG